MLLCGAMTEAGNGERMGGDFAVKIRGCKCKINYGQLNTRPNNDAKYRAGEVGLK